ncbi:hypothetical protein H7T43_09295 [Peribacillus simplex]|uniref:hypothetical protein n=1 Tax=Peribacillus simplex TaxID=1478 RepID=UPI00298A00AD|nr:hypothetical protein [Peribacillus simplex]MBX9955110.1 hypothetical protein [Peribacillus simplex]
MLTLEDIKKMTSSQIADQIDEVREVMAKKHERDEAAKTKSREDKVGGADDIGNDDGDQNVPLTLDRIKTMTQRQIADRILEVRQVLDQSNQIN